MEQTQQPFNDDLRQKLIAYRDRNQLTLASLARELGCHITQASKYVNGHPDWDVGKLESIIEDVLHTEGKRKSAQCEAVLTHVTKIVWGVLEKLRKTNDIGVITGPAGVGKTMGIKYYVPRNPSSIFLTATEWNCRGCDMERLVFEQLSTRSWKCNTKRGDYLVGKLKGSNRLIIVDGGQELRQSGIAWLSDFWDATGCPICLVGNRSILDKLRVSEQHFSRVGLWKDIKLTPAQSASIGSEIVSGLAPEASAELAEFVGPISEKSGCFRALAKHINLARTIIEHAAEKTSWKDAICSANRQLISDCVL